MEKLRWMRKNLARAEGMMQVILAEALQYRPERSCCSYKTFWIDLNLDSNLLACIIHGKIALSIPKDGHARHRKQNLNGKP